MSLGTELDALLGTGGAGRYVFTIHSKVKHGISAGGSFIVGYFPGDAAALSFADWLETAILANRAKVTVSKTIHLASNEELPASFSATDEQTVKVLLGSSADRDARVSLRIPKMRTDVGANWLSDLVSKGLQTYKGHPLDRVISTSASMQNIVAGPPAVEPDFQTAPLP